MATVVNIHKAKTTLSKLVETVETGAEKEIVIARNGRPVARLVPLEPVAPPLRRLGLLEHLGDWEDADLEQFNALDREVQHLFENGPIFPDVRPGKDPDEPAD